MRIIEIAALDNGAHRNQNGGMSVVPEGWAVIPETMTIPGTFPFVNITVKDGVVTSMTAGIVPEVEPVEPTKQREEAYNTAKVVGWEGELLTVTEAAQLWQYYAAEGNEKANMLTGLIAEAKATIREKYPDTSNIIE